MAGSHDHVSLKLHPCHVQFPVIDIACACAQSRTPYLQKRYFTKIDMEIHWRAALQVKGFLKIVEMVSAHYTLYLCTYLMRTLQFFQFFALLALALVAGFWVNHDVTCNEFRNPRNMSQMINGTLTATASTQYAFLTISINVTGMDSIGTVLYNVTNVTNLGGGFTSASQFFVTWGVFTLFYGVIALAVYIFTTANLELEWLVNYLVLTVSLRERERWKGDGGERER